MKIIANKPTDEMPNPDGEEKYYGWVFVFLLGIAFLVWVALAHK